MADLEPMPISTLPKADQLETDDQMIAYREETGKAYRSNVGALGEAAQDAISDAFSETKTYNAGDYCIYNDTLYKFTEDKDIGAWDDSVVEKTTATAEIQSITDLIDSSLGGVQFIPYTALGSGSNMTVTYQRFCVIFAVRGANSRCGLYYADYWSAVGTFNSASGIAVSVSDRTVTIENTANNSTSITIFYL